MMKLSSIYKKAFETDCFELLEYAYDMALSEKIYQTDWHENDFSELLKHYVNESQLSLEKGITCITESKLFSKTKKLDKGFAINFQELTLFTLRSGKKPDTSIV